MHNDTQHNDTQHNDTSIMDLIATFIMNVSPHNDTEHKHKKYAEYHIFIFMLNAIMLSAVVSFKQVTAILTFTPFAIEKCETLKFRICSKETEIWQSSFEGNESESKSEQRMGSFKYLFLDEFLV